MKKKGIAVAVGVFLGVAHAFSMEVFVDTKSIGGSARDGNPGSIEKPFKTINAALKAAGPGTTVYIRSGVYYETVEVVRGGTPDRPITIKSYNGEYVLIDGQNIRPHGFLFPGDTMDFRKGLVPEEGNGDHVRIEGLRLANFLAGNKWGVAIQASGRTGIVVKNVEIDNADHGILLMNCRDCEILDSEIHHCWPIRMLAPCHNIRIDHNEMHHCNSKKCYAVNIWGPANSSIARVEVSSVRKVAPGIMECTFKDFDASKFVYYKSNLAGLDAGESGFNPHSLIFYYEVTKSTGGSYRNPDYLGDIKGGEKLLQNDKESFVLLNNPQWGGKPYSPDGKKLRFRADKSLFGELKKAKFAHIINTWKPEYQMSSDIQITNNRIYDSNCQGIQTSNTDYLFIKGNTIYDCGASGIQIEDNCHQVWIEDNEIYANSVLGGGECNVWIHLDKDVVVQNNRLHESQAGIKVNSSERILVRHNAIFNNLGQHAQSAKIVWAPKIESVGSTKPSSFRENSAGIVLQGGGHGGMSAPPVAKDVVFAHNTLYNNAVSRSVNRCGSFMLGVLGYPKERGSITFLNNIIYSDHNENLICMYYNKPQTIDGNLYKGSADACVLACKEAGASIKTFPIATTNGFANYQQLFQQDVNSKYGEPAFADPEKHDFRLKAGSEAIDLGVALTVTASNGSGTQVPVENIHFFSEGYKTSKGEVLVEGDIIMVGQEKVQIVGIDRDEGILEIDRGIEWSVGESVSYAYSGSAPDAGAFEYPGEKRVFNQ